MIGICSGFFNPLHAGHIDYFEASKEYCDKLLVIVNNDIQVQRKGRAFMDQATRLRIIQSLRVVDWACTALDEDDSVSETIDFLARVMTGHGFVFLNSGDRNVSNINAKEKAVCEKHGIMTKYLDLPKVDSSSNYRS